MHSWFPWKSPSQRIENGSTDGCTLKKVLNHFEVENKTPKNEFFKVTAFK